MLVLSRKIDEAIHINGNIKIKVVNIGGGRVRLGIEAPADVRIIRGEIDEWSELASSDAQPAKRQLVAAAT